MSILTINSSDAPAASLNTGQRSNSAFTYIPTIDGLRALSVAAVIVYHVWPQALPGGFTGVDVFFVISGFLVTSILLKEQQRTGGIRLSAFWKRRVRRLMPTGLLVIATTLLAGILTLDSAALKDLGAQSLSALLFSANIYMWRVANDYWAPVAEALPLLHTWSLAVEEQFYFLLPLCMWMLRGRRLLIVLVTTTLISFGSSLYASHYHRAAAFYLIPSRAWELLAGVLLAIVCVRSSSFSRTSENNRTSQALRAAGIVLILCGFVFVSGVSMFPVPSALLPVVGTTLVIASTQMQSSVDGSLLSSQAFTYAGRLSYALYLWHWPLLTFCRLKAWPLGLVSLCLPLSVLTYEYVEKPTRRQASVSVLLGLFAATLLISAFAAMGSISPLTAESYPQPKLVTGYDSQHALADGGVHVGQESNRRRVVVLGNSMAYQHARLINSVFSEYWITYLTVGGTPARFLDAGEDGTDTTPPVTWTHQQRLEFDRIRRSALKTQPAFILVSERWNVASPEEQRRTTDFIRQLLDSAGHVIVFLDSPALDVADTMSMHQLAETYSNPEMRQQLQEVPNVREARVAARRFFRDLQKMHQSLLLIDPESILTLDDGTLPVVRDGKILFGNRTHLSISGTMLLEPELRQLVRDSNP